MPRTSTRSGTGSPGLPAAGPAVASDRGQGDAEQRPAHQPISAGRANAPASGITAAASTPNHCSMIEQ